MHLLIPLSQNIPEGTSLSDLGEDRVCSIWVLAAQEGLSDEEDLRESQEDVCMVPN